MYVYIKDNHVQRIGNIPKVWKLKDGRTISGFHLVNSGIHKQEGWLPLEDNKPEYNEETHYLTNPQYEILEDKVVRTWEVAENPPMPDPVPSKEDILESEIAELWFHNMTLEFRLEDTEVELSQLWYEIMIGGM